MNTENFDKQAQSHLAFYENFLTFAKYCVVAIVIVLVGMAVFLL